MTRISNARFAGIAFLVYIAAGLTGLVLSGRATAGKGAAARIATAAGHLGDLRLALVLGLIGCFCALVLAVMLYALTRDADPDLALLVLVFRTGERVIGGVSLSRELGRPRLATSGSAAPDPAAEPALGAVLFDLPDASSQISASFFAVGSLAFSYLLWRGRMVPVVLSWIGILASVLIVVGLPLQLAGLIGSPLTDVMWIPMLASEIPLALWLIVKGAAAPVRRTTASPSEVNDLQRASSFLGPQTKDLTVPPLSAALAPCRPRTS